MSKNSKALILERIKKGLSKAQFKDGLSDNYTNDEIFYTQEKPLIEIFEEELVKISGKFIYCENEAQVSEKLSLLNNKIGLKPVFCSDKTLASLLKNAGIDYISEFDDNEEEVKTGISACEYLIARFGSVLVSSAIPGARKVFSFPHTHIVIAYENQLVLEIDEGINGIRGKYSDLPSQITNITGPSRTADIEKTLILGAHGPKELIVFVIK